MLRTSSKTRSSWLPSDSRSSRDSARTPFIRMVQVEGLSLRAAAEVLGRSYEATKKLYGRAVANFKDLLEG